ncbi:UDP-N-acetylglucosamine 1-carboxyvinyltransferase [Ammoniphilus oxalaticus]|uniref:UDP-N-acetylglucosamine 1-carboxyvinyltransferase n=1 Tax=Ammoniphilus oxalaticus TaxID=66863 RepID=A0A419SJG8_9BACL|nr:UDP-N-acetylglucosamine 1-carboxyvinyltransferase [Ammoniphilus oxalaticus]RKD24102.1 UDP-N-acetylglucosamine 1-carboxyvinyltransferase [Ammoniphilus oxalaticus]
MEKFAVQGGKPLNGSLRIHGSKNAALPILAAATLAEGQSSIQDVPHLIDINVMLEILNALGAEVTHQNSSLQLDTSSLSSSHIPQHLMGKMRSSIFLMGPLLAKLGQVTVYPPGGCAIGDRKIDLHLQGLAALGAKVEVEKDYIHCAADQLVGADIKLAYPSVGATENIMMAATLANGRTLIRNAAREPEIIDLQDFLNQMGAKVQGAGTSVIEIEGVKRLKSTDYRVIPDRIVAGTMMLAVSMTKGELLLENINMDHLAPLVKVIEGRGVEINYSHDIINIASQNCARSISFLETGPYPHFPTDMQAQLMAYLSLSSGRSVIRETVFNGRFRHVEQLQKMGARIDIQDNSAVIYGDSVYQGAEVEATDLRAGAALILAGLAAQGVTLISQIHHIDRGYQRIEEQLQSVGASIKRIREKS